jgi:hypothetical protein
VPPVRARSPARGRPPSSRPPSCSAARPTASFFKPTSTDPYCANYPPLPTTDTFWGRGTLHVDGYVVLDRAVTAVTPDGRDDVFPHAAGAHLPLRLRDSDGRERPLTVEHLTTGATCADDPAAICVPLG